MHKGHPGTWEISSPPGRIDRNEERGAYQVVLLDEFRRHAVTVIFLQGPKGETAEDELLVHVNGMISEYERTKILERCRRGKIHRARQGAVSPMSGAPYGFLYVKKTDDAPASYRVLLHEAKASALATLDPVVLTFGGPGAGSRTSIVIRTAA